MLRDKSLIPLSRQHQHALALCVRIDRSSPIKESNLPTWQAEVAQQFEAEIKIHFTAEEQFVFPSAREFEELTSLVGELLAEHVVLRRDFARAEALQLSAEELRSFAERLSTHIRKEERQLFQRLQELLEKEQLDSLGKRLEESLKDATQVCSLPQRPAP